MAAADTKPLVGVALKVFFNVKEQEMTIQNLNNAN